MHFGSRKLRPVLAAVFVAVSLLFTLVPAGAVDLGLYSATVAPDGCEYTQCANTALTFSITNQSPDTRFVMSTATITVPTKLTLLPNSVGNPTVDELLVAQKTWTKSVSGGVVTLAASQPTDTLLPGETVNVSLNVGATLSSVGPHTFKTTASSPTGEPTFRNTGADPKLDVVTDEVNCPATESCQTATVEKAEDTQAGISKTSASAFSPGGSGAAEASLRISVGGGFGDSIKGGFCEREYLPDLKYKGWSVTSEVGGDPEATRSHLVTVRLGKTIANSPGSPGAGAAEVCVAADENFVTKGGLSGGTAPDAEFNAATGMWEGVLPNCNALNPAITKCVESRARNSGDAIIKYFVDPGDPIGLPGLGPFNG